MTTTEPPRTYDTRWDHHYAALAQYAARTGTTRVPSTHREPFEGQSVPLGAWVSAQRRRGRAGLLSAGRHAKLAGLADWAWGPLPPGPNCHDERNAAILARRAEGASFGAIATEYGLTRQRVHQIVTRGR